LKPEKKVTELKMKTLLLLENFYSTWLKVFVFLIQANKFKKKRKKDLFHLEDLN
jgi:hypothetical protein